jgi:hypothetical protein
MYNINEKNIIDVSESKLLANTPMMVIEQNGQIIAVPIMGSGGGGGTDVSGVTAQQSDVLNTVKFVNSDGQLLDGTM